MSREGNCYDNASMESFWGTPKRELVPWSLRHTGPNPHSHLQMDQNLEIFYNRERIHSALGFNSPVDFETNLN